MPALNLLMVIRQVQRQKRRLQSLFSISKLGGASRAVRKDDEEEEDVDYDSTTEMSPPKPDSKRSKTPAQKANADDPASSTGSLNRKATIAGTPFNKRETDVRKAKPTPSAQTPSTVKQEAASKESSSLPPTTPAPSSSSSSSSTDTKNATLLSPADSVASDVRSPNAACALFARVMQHTRESEILSGSVRACVLFFSCSEAMCELWLALAFTCFLEFLYL